MADKIRNVKVAFVVDDSGLRAADAHVDHLKKTINDSSSALNKMGAASDRAFNPTEVKQYNAAVQAGATAQKRSVEDLSKVYTNLKTVIKNSFDLDQLRKYEAEMEQVKKEAGELGVNLDKAGKKAKETGSSFGKLGDSIKNALSNSPIGGFINSLDQAKSSAKDVGDNLGEIGKKSQGSSGGVMSLGNAIKVGLLGTLALVIVAFSSVIAFIKQTDEGALKLESTMDGLGAATDVLTGRLASLGSQLVESFNKATGSTTGFGEKFLSVLSTVYPGIGLLAKAVGSTGLAKDMKAAFNEASALTVELDNVQDGMRSLTVETTQTELAIQALIKQTKNRGLDIGDRLKIVAEAQGLETENLNKNFEIQKRYYDIIARITLQKVTNINSDKASQILQVQSIVNQIKQAKTANELLRLYQAQEKAQIGLRNTTDVNNQKQVDALNTIITLVGKSEVVQEKYASMTSVLIEKDIADRVEAIKKVERARQAAAITSISDEKKLAEKTFDIQIDSLEAQRKVYVKYERDVTAIDLEIANLRKKHADDAAKDEAARRAKEKAEAEKQAKALQQILNDSYRQEKVLNAQGYNEKQKQLADQYTSGLIDQKNYHEQKKALDYEQKRNETENDIAFLQNKLDTEALNSSDRITAQEQLNAKQKELDELDVANFGKAAADKNDLLQQQLTKTAQVVAITQSIISSVYQIGAENDSALAAFQKTLALVTIGINAASAVSNAIAAAKGVTGIDYIIQVGAGVAAVLAAIAQAKQILSSSGSIPSSPQLKSVPTSSGNSGTPQSTAPVANDVKKFAAGVIDLQGGVSGVDSISSLLMPGESVMTTAETRMFKPTLMAIRNKQVSPEVLNSLGNRNGSVAVKVDNSELAAIYKNRPVHEMNIDENGFTKYIISKTKREQVISSKYSM